MDLKTISMERSKAREAFLEYRDAVRARHSDEDAAIMRGYRVLAQGRQLLNLRETISAGGVNELGQPRLAVMQADQHWCYLRRTQDGAVTFARVQRWYDRWVEGIYRFPSGTLPEHQDLSIVRWGVWSQVRAMVPIIPPGLRPAYHLRNYAILWEVDKWQALPEPPKDPALLKHISGELYAVVAVWELTDLERAVLAGRTADG